MDDASGQLDLFHDNEGVALERELLSALCRQRFEPAVAALDRLQAHRPDHPRLGAYGVLVRDGSALWWESDDPLVALRRLEERMVPAAAVLGSRAATFLPPLWQRLSERLATHPYDPAAPRWHASYAAICAGDWPAVRAAVEREPDWSGHVPLVSRRLEAAVHLGEDVLALEMLCRLCWVFPETAGERLEGNPRYGAAYRAFLDLEEELPVCDFPAWYALTHRWTLPVQLAGVHNPAAAALAEAVNGVLAERAGTPDVSARRRLRDRHPALFTIYMNRRRQR